MSNLNIKTETVSVLSFAIRQDEGLSAKVKPIWQACHDGQSYKEIANNLSDVFSAARGEYLAAKKANARTKMAAVSKAWHRISAALRNHATQAELTLGFPNLRSGDGETTVETKKDASDRRKVEKADREAKDAADLAAFEQQQQQQQLDALQGMSPQQLAESFYAQLTTWSDDPMQQRKVLVLLHATLTQPNGLASQSIEDEKLAA